MAPHGKVLVNASIRHRLCKNDSSHLSKASRKQSKKKVRQSFESTNNSEIFNVSSGGNPILCLQKRILSPSCLPAFGKVVFIRCIAWFLIAREIFPSRARGIRIFWQDNITTFFAPCQSCKIVSSCRAWSSERPGPGASAGGVRPAQMRSSGWVMRGWMIVWLVYWWSGLDDAVFLIFEEYFWSDWGCFDGQMDLIISCLWCSLLFICSVPTLPALSPAVLLLKFHRM